MSARLTRRHFLKASLGALGATALAACAPKPAAPPATKEPVAGQPTTAVAEPTAAQPASSGTKSLRLSAWADVSDAVVYENIVKAWQARQSDYTATVEQYPGGYYEKVQANFAADDAADVIYFQGWMAPAYADNGVLLALDDFIAKTGSGDKFPDSVNYKCSTQWKGKTYVTPTDCGSLVVMYNKDLFDKQGIPYPKKGWTWEDFQEIVRKLSFTEGDTRYYGWAQAGGWNGTYTRMIHFMRMNGYLEWDELVEPKKALFDHEDVYSALQFLISDTLTNEWCPAPDVITGGGVGVDTGRVAMVLEGPWYLPRLWGELASQPPGIQYDIVEPPVGKANRNCTTTYIHGHTIAAKSSNPEGAWSLIQFILSDEGQKIIADGGRMCGTPTNIEKIWGPVSTKAYNFSDPGAFANGMRTGSAPPIFGEGIQVEGAGSPIVSMWDAMLGLQMQAKEAVQAYNPQIQEMLDAYWKERA